MSTTLNQELNSLVQRTGSASNRLDTVSQRTSFASNVRADLANLVNVHNSITLPLFESLISEVGLEALDFGIAGNVIKTDLNASAGSATAYWSSELGRARSIKETIDVLLVEIAELENAIDSFTATVLYDDTDVRNLIATNNVDLDQLKIDIMGANYTLDGDGVANLSYSISQAVDAIGAFFSGFPGTGNTYPSSYPALSLSILLSDITIDTTLPQSTITNLVDHLSYIRTFIGMGTVGPETPTYSDHGAINFVSDATSLEVAIQALDTGLTSHASRHISGGADEIDGDQLDIDWNPANYTPTTTPTEATSVDHLTAHLAGIDAALASAGVTLQGAYTAGGAGTSGDIQLTNAKGEIAILNDTVSPLTEVLKWVDGASADVGYLTNSGIRLVAESNLELPSVSTPPGPAASAGKLFVDTSSTGGGGEELYYRNNVALDDDAQITRDGIVKELELGSYVVYGKHMEPEPAGATVASKTVTPGNYVVQTMDFSAIGSENVYTEVPIPVDEDGNPATRARLVGHFVPLPVGGPYPGGNEFAFNISVPNGVAVSSLHINDSLAPGWTLLINGSATGLSAGSIDTLQVIDFGEVTWNNGAGPGLLPMRITRDNAAPGSNWDDDVGLICLMVTWYR